MLMASSKVIASGSSPNSDLPPTSSINIHSDQAIRGFGSMNVDEIFQNIYPDSAAFEAAGDGGISSVDGVGRNGNKSRTVEEVWRDMVQGGGGREPAMTLEDFLAKAGAVNEEDVRVPAMRSLGLGVMMSMHNVIGGELRGKRKVAVEEDKATQQKQRRMIKNRESAARSRERKQAYTVELESLVAQLEEENARLVREEVQLHRERLKQLMENIIPVGEKRRPPSPRNLRRMRSI